MARVTAATSASQRIDSGMPMGPSSWPGIIERYREFLPVEPGERVVTLHEGNTPLVRADRLQSVLRLVGVGSAVGGLVAAFAFALSLLSIPMLRPSGGRR